MDDITRMIEGIIAARRAEGRDHGDLLSQLVLAQDEETCVVYGMPRVAADMGAVEESCPLGSIGNRALAACEN